MVSLAVALYASASVPYFLLVDAEEWAWPRPQADVCRVRALVWDVSRSDAAYPLLRGWDNARHTVRESCRDAAALLILLTTSPKGALQ
jgi:hypothetical protein